MTKILLPLITALALSTPAFGQSGDVSNESDESNVVFLGALGLQSPEYLGSDENETRILPYISVQDYKGFDLFATTLSYRALETGTGQGLGKWSLRAGPSLTYEAGRESEDSPTLTGLEDIGGSVIAGGYVRGTFGPVGLRFSAGQDIAGGHGGISANASVGTFLPLGRLKIQPSASVSWGSADFNQSFFGITQAQANASRLTVNDVDSGIYGYSVNLVSWYEITDDYVISLIGSHRWFAGDADDSPILLAEDGSETGLFVGIGVARRFDF